MSTTQLSPSGSHEFPKPRITLGLDGVVKRQYGSCKQIKLCDDVVSMGRDAACLIQLDDKMFADIRDENIQYVKLSRVHFTVTRDKHGITLVDKSMNGTYVNKLLGRAVAQASITGFVG